MPLETNGVIADYSPVDESLTVYANTQVPQVFRTALSIVFQIPRSRIRIIVPDSGAVLEENFPEAFGARNHGLYGNWKTCKVY